MSLEAAETSDDPAQRLSLLLEAWRSKKSLELRALVLTASARAAPVLPPGTSRLLAKEWDEIEAQARPADLPRLLAAIPHETPTEGLRRLEILLKRGEDPRIWDVCVQWFEHPPFARRTSASRYFWDWLGNRLGEAGDPALGPRLAEVKTGGNDAQQSYLRNMAKRIAKRVPSAAPALDDGERAVLSRMRAAIEAEAADAGKKAVEGARSEQQLLDAVYADPDSDEPRLVYADWLQERGDPWGELIVLQLAKRDAKAARAAGPRIAELIRKHGAARVQGLPVAPDAVVFRRGFPAEGVVVVGVPEQSGDPRWATFESLRFPHWDNARTIGIAADPAKRSLREIAVHGEVADALARGTRTLRLRTLEILSTRVGTRPIQLQDLLDTIAASERFPELEVLRFARGVLESWSVLLATTIARKVKRFEADAAGWRESWRIARERLDGGGSRLELVVLGRLLGIQQPAIEASIRAAAEGVTAFDVTSPKPLGAATRRTWLKVVEGVLKS